MNGPDQIPNDKSLAFFGKVNASISHELKNILAVISETAGLLSDLIEASKSGRKLELETLSTCGKTIVEEVQRGFGTIKQMNRFAHSVDEPIKEIDVAEVIELMVNLSMYLSYAGTVRIDAPKDPRFTALTRPFLLQDLIYESLIFAFRSAGLGAQIRITVDEAGKDLLSITFHGLGAGKDPAFPDETLQKVAASIGAQIRLVESSDTVEIQIPKDIHEISH